MLDPPAWDSYGAGISDDRRIVSVYYQQGIARWEQGVGYEVMPYSGAGGVALDISGDGSLILGRTASVGASAPREHEALTWSPGDQVNYLGDLPGGIKKAAALASSFDGSVVGGYGTTDDGSRAFIWDATEGMRQLDLVLTMMGVDLAGWTLSEAQSISNDGFTIMGIGTNPSDESEALIAVIPEPSTALLVGAGLIAMGSHAGRRRRG